jgi:hypothetical protein
MRDENLENLIKALNPLLKINERLHNGIISNRPNGRVAWITSAMGDSFFF